MFRIKGDWIVDTKISPNFIGIGAQKCATTWLYDLLDLHPAVGLSPLKEIHFFSQYFGYGLQWYQSHFSEVDPQLSVIGEFSTSYFCDFETPHRIKQCYPDAKLVLMLRDPIKRLQSNHKHEIRVGHLTGPDFSIEAGLKNNPTYVQQGLYATHLKRWLEYFSRDQIHIVLYDQLKNDPAAVERELYEFLQLDSLSNHQQLAKSNPSYVYRSQGTEQARRAVLKLARGLKLEKAYRGVVSKSGLQSAYRKMNRTSPQQLIPEIKEDTLQSLAELFLPEIIELEKMLDIDLSAWKQPKEQAQ